MLALPPVVPLLVAKEAEREEVRRVKGVPSFGNREDVMLLERAAAESRVAILGDATPAARAVRGGSVESAPGRVMHHIAAERLPLGSQLVPPRLHVAPEPSLSLLTILISPSRL